MPRLVDYDLDVFRCYMKVGDIFKLRADSEGALKEYERAAATARDAATSDPANVAWQRNLAESYTNIGDLLVAQGRTQEALEHYRNALQFADNIAAKDTDGAQWAALAQAFKTEINKLTSHP